MQREFQEKIMGYYIEETKDNLNTLEQNLMNLPNKLNEHPIIDALLSSCNSLAGGAGMLGIDSISRASCCLKSCIQILQLEGPIEVDRKLKELFMQVVEEMKDLVEYLNYYSCLTDDKANQVMSKIDFAIANLRSYIDVLVKRSHDDTPSFDDDFLSLFDDFLVENYPV